MKECISSQTQAGTELCFKDAVDLTPMIRARERSATELMAAFLAQIESVNPKVNAICTSIGEELAMRAAEAVGAQLAKGHPPGPLHGLPMAVKDLVATAGIRTIYAGTNNRKEERITTL